jgi:hypothetical protein
LTPWPTSIFVSRWLWVVNNGGAQFGCPFGWFYYCRSLANLGTCRLLLYIIMGECRRAMVIIFFWHWILFIVFAGCCGMVSQHGFVIASAGMSINTVIQLRASLIITPMSNPPAEPPLLHFRLPDMYLCLIKCFRQSVEIGKCIFFYASNFSNVPANLSLVLHHHCVTVNRWASVWQWSCWWKWASLNDHKNNKA